MITKQLKKKNLEIIHNELEVQIRKLNQKQPPPLNSFDQPPKMQILLVRLCVFLSVCHKNTIPLSASGLSFLTHKTFLMILTSAAHTRRRRRMIKLL